MIRRKRNIGAGLKPQEKMVVNQSSDVTVVDDVVADVDSARYSLSVDIDGRVTGFSLAADAFQIIDSGVLDPTTMVFVQDGQVAGRITNLSLDGPRNDTPVGVPIPVPYSDNYVGILTDAAQFGDTRPSAPPALYCRDCGGVTWSRLYRLTCTCGTPDNTLLIG